MPNAEHTQIAKLIMEPLLAVTLCCGLAVLAFDYTNGFHDAANIIATVIASRAMTPAQAVMIVAVFEFLGPLLGGTAVANTIGGFIELSELQSVRALTIILCGLIGAMTWNLITWARGIPSSSSHALVGGLIGAIVIATDVEHIHWGFAGLLQGQVNGVLKVLLALLLSPIAGFVVGYGLHRLMRLLLRSASPRINRPLRGAQFVTTAGLAFSHGANDAQKSMGILTLVLVLGGFLDEFRVPLWVMFGCAAAMTLGILSGGWRIVRTLGFAIYKVRPVHAVGSQLTAAGIILSASALGAPVSTTHVVASSIIGIGASERPRSVRWSKAADIARAWLLTIPASALVGAISYAIIHTIIIRGTP